MNKKWVVVTTEHRGVFFGRQVSPMQDGSVELESARNCVYWNADTRGFLGLAAHGPKAGCRIGPPVPKLLLVKVTSIAVCTDEAKAAWEAAPWS